MPLPLAFFFAFLALWTLPISVAYFKRHKDMEKVVVGALSLMLWPFALFIAVFEG